MNNSLRIVHTSDFHGHLTTRAAEKIRVWKGDGLYFDCGDLIKAGNLAWPVREDPGWRLLSEAGVTAGTMGNRETHPLEGAFAAKLSGCSEMLVANLERKGAAHEPLQIGSCRILDHRVLETCGLRIGVFGVMVPMVTERMKSSVASAFLWGDPLAAAASQVESLRERCELLIALTHIGLSNDLKLAETCPSIDVILGGHSHSVKNEPILVGSTWISHTGSHGRFAGVYDWDGGTLSGGLESLR